MSLSTRLNIINNRVKQLNHLIGRESGRPLPDSLIISDLKRRRLQLEDMRMQIQL